MQEVLVIYLFIYLFIIIIIIIIIIILCVFVYCLYTNLLWGVHSVADAFSCSTVFLQTE